MRADLRGLVAVLRSLAGAAALAVLAASARADIASQCIDSHEGAADSIRHCTVALEDRMLPSERRAKVLTRRALARFNQGELDRAAEDLDAAIGLDSRSFWAYNSRGIVRIEQGDLARGIDDFDQAVRLKPDYAFALANRGNAWLARGDTARALADLDRAVEFKPPSLELALVSRGRAHMAAGQFDLAVRDFDAALQLKPGYANALSARGFARFCRGDFGRAADDFAAAREAAPSEKAAVDWLMARRRAGHQDPGELTAATRGLATDSRWPAVLALFAGRLTPDEAVQAADAGEGGRYGRWRVCETSFEVGQWYLLSGDKAAARAQFVRARNACEPSMPEYAGAGVELAMLK